MSGEMIVRQNGGLMQAGGQPVVVQVPEIASLAPVVSQVLGDTHTTIQQAVSMLDKDHDTAIIRRRIVIHY